MKIIYIFLIVGIIADGTGDISYNYSSYNSTKINYPNAVQYLYNNYDNLIIQNNEDSSVLLFYQRNNLNDPREFNLNNTFLYKNGKSNKLSDTFSYCINSAVLDSSYRVKLYNSFINTTGEGSIALCSTDGGSLSASNTIITTVSSNSYGLHAVNGGRTSASGSTIQTFGDNSPALSAKKSSEVSCTNCKLYTYGKGSPLVDTKGNCWLSNTTGYAEKSQGIIIDGKVEVQIYSGSSLKFSGAGSSTDLSDACGILIKNTSDGNGYDQGTSTDYTNIRITSASLEMTSETAPLILVDGAHTYIYINMQSTIKSKIFLKIKNTSSKTDIMIVSSEVEGDIIADENADINLNIQGSSKFKGAINPDGKAGFVNVFIAEGATVTLTGDSNVDEYYNSDQTKKNVITNGFKLDPEEDSSLGLLSSKVMLLLIACLVF